MTHYSAIPAETILKERYKILMRLGQGTSSCVYKALDLKTASFVSIKILDPFLIHDPISVERFQRESQILRQINHPQVIKVFDIDFSTDQKWMVMEYFEGRDLKNLICDKGKIFWENSLQYISTICEILESCHSQGIVHRDLKPQNILINDQGDIRIVDFGVSKVSGMSDLTKTGTMIGTPEYMAPEQFSKSVLDYRTDLYALGTIFYEMINGHPPFMSKQISQLLNQKMNPEAIKDLLFEASSPEWLQKIIKKCLRIDPISRYQNCKELLRDIKSRENAIASFEEGKDKALCFKCRADILPGFSFCYQCGAFQVSLFAKGKSCLVIHNCKEQEELANYLGNLFKSVGIDRFRKELNRLPFFLLKNVEADTARNLANELVYFRAQVQVTDRPAQEFQLPILIVLLGLLTSIAIWVIFAKFSWILTVGAFILIEVSLFALFKAYSRPLISSQTYQERDSQIPKMQKKILMQVAGLKSRSSKALMGKIVQMHFQCGKGSEISNSGPSENLLLKGLALAEQMDTYEYQLEQQNLVSLKANIQRAEVQMKMSNDLNDVNAFNMAKTQLRSYYQLQDVFAETRVQLLNILSELSVSNK